MESRLLNNQNQPVAVRDTAAMEVLRMAEVIAERAERVNGMLAERLASVTNQQEGPKNELAEVQRDFPPLFSDLRQYLQRISNALNGIEDTTHRTEL